MQPRPNYNKTKISSERTSMMTWRKSKNDRSFLVRLRLLWTNRKMKKLRPKILSRSSKSPTRWEQSSLLMLNKLSKLCLRKTSLREWSSRRETRWSTLIVWNLLRKLRLNGAMIYRNDMLNKRRPKTTKPPWEKASRLTPISRLCRLHLESKRRQRLSRTYF